MSQGKVEQRAAREARLQKALRENLKRRKAQARGRTAEERAVDQGEAAETEDGVTSREPRS